MKKPTENKKEYYQKIQGYKDDFHKTFGIELIINIKKPLEITETISLNDLGIVIDEILNNRYPGIFPEGIKTKSRREEVLNYRQCYCKIAMDRGYGCSEIARAIGFNHANILHSRKFVNNMIDINDPVTMFNLNNIYNELKERFSPNADIQSDQSAEHNT